MSDQVNLDQNVMEYLLSALREDEAGRLAADDTFEPVSDSSPAPLTETQRQMALQLKRFTDQMPGGFFIYHADGDEELIYANTALIRLFGCETLTEFKELTGNSFRGIVHPDDLEAVEESIWQQISNSRYDLDYVEFRIIQKDGSLTITVISSAANPWVIFFMCSWEMRQSANPASLRRRKRCSTSRFRKRKSFVSSIRNT